MVSVDPMDRSMIFLITFNFCIHFKRENFFFSFCFLVAPVKVYKKVVKFSFKRQKIFWVLVFSFMYLVLVDAMDRSYLPNYPYNTGQLLSVRKNVKMITNVEIRKFVYMRNAKKAVEMTIIA